MVMHGTGFKTFFRKKVLSKIYAIQCQPSVGIARDRIRTCEATKASAPKADGLGHSPTRASVFSFLFKKRKENIGCQKKREISLITYLTKLIK